ncbi:MAG TPA: OstA-like protein [Bacteroidales bacterium]|nr:OstA-like protein [Bacteroidales bacterium]
MGEIKSFIYLLNISTVRYLLYLLIFLLFSSALHSQSTPVKNPGRNSIELLNADDDIIMRDPITGKDIHRFHGNVQFRHNEITMSCDSAHFSPDKNQVTAFSKIHIEQGDTLDLFGDYLFYNGKSEIAFVNGNVELIDKETHLYTDTINYDVKNRIARYTDNGRITNAENTLTSIIGVYFVRENLFHFKDSVKIVNPDYVITADTMDYNTETETAFFTGPTELNGDSLYTYCEKGWFDTKFDVSSLWKNAMIDTRKQIIHGDSLYFDDKSGYGESFGNVVIEDTTNNLIIKGNYAWYFKEPESFMVTDRAMFIQNSNGDSLFLHADTISAITVSDTSGKGYRLMRAYYGCRIFSENLQAKCDSLSYSYQDSVIRFYKSPIIWSEENQLTSDSMAIFTKNQKTDRLELYNSAFVTSQIDSTRFNQIKGRSLVGYFINNELHKINIKGNGESIYFLLDGPFIAGINQSKCANIEAYVEKGKITEIYEYQNPVGFIDPPLLPSSGSLRLEGFNWFDNLRPKNKADIFKK